MPAGTATHVLYVQDGQNLFNPNALWGGWQLDTVAPAGMMLVGIDNSPAGADNYCENKQLESVLYSVGYTANVDVWHW